MLSQPILLPSQGLMMVRKIPDVEGKKGWRGSVHNICYHASSRRCSSCTIKRSNCIAEEKGWKTGFKR